MTHISVLLDEVVELLDIKDDKTYVDLTLGQGGHSKEILKRLKTGHLYAFDKDLSAIEKSRLILSDFKNITYIHSDFIEVNKKLYECNIQKVDGIVIDLGVSSNQFDEIDRGFSYRFDSRLDMRMNKQQILDAHYIINKYPIEKLIKIFYEYGEEKFARSIAKNIIKKRDEKVIETTFELVEIIKDSLPSKVLSKKGHPAKKVFQAIRIETNNEIEHLQIVLKKCINLLNENGILCVISFHSLEDRIIKHTFKKYTEAEKIDKRIPIIDSKISKSKYELITKNVIIPSKKELEENNRSHSAKLRAIKKKGIDYGNN